MPMSEPQSYRNHSRFEPMFHFFVAPVMLLNVIVTIVVLVHHWPYHLLLHFWLVIMALALFLLTGIARSYALKVQDRVIRLEEQLRYLRLLAPEQVVAAQALTIKQIIGLRFASDAELPALLERTVAENLSQKAIKQAIVSWRPDTFRV
jgi:hypothetical protein